MSLGMSYDEYWYAEVDRIHSYRELDRLKQERINNEAWLNGLYIYDALSVVIQNAFSNKRGKTVNYPEKPYELFKKAPTEEEKAREVQEEREKAIAYFKGLAERSKQRKQQKQAP